MGEHRPGRRPGLRLPMTEAAEVLGTSRDAVRMRVRRGSLESEKGEDGRVYVFVEPDRDAAHPVPQDEGSSSPLVEALKDEIAHLRRESERKDAIIMSLSQSNAELSRTIRAIEAPSEPPRSPVEHLEDEEVLREEAQMEARDAETRQSGHFQRYGAPRRDTPSEPPGAPEMAADEQQGRGPPLPETTGVQEAAERVSWWRRMFGG